GCTVEPQFFRYPLYDLSGDFHYANGRVELTRLSARHDGSVVSLRKGDVRLYPDGGLYVVLNDLQGNPVVPTAEFLDALPESLKSGCTSLKLKDPFALTTDLVVSLSGVPGSQPDVYWDGQLWMRNASLEAGVPIEGITGRGACRGRY